MKLLFGSTRRTILLGVVLLILGAAYLHGTFDHPLYGVGLNYNTCARNGFGAVFCGKELDEYQQNISNAEQQGQQAAGEIRRTECQVDPQLSGC